MSDVLFTASDMILGSGIVGLYGFIWWQGVQQSKGRVRLEEKLVKKIDSLMTRVDCLQTLHLVHHPEDRGVVDEVCQEAGV